MKHWQYIFYILILFSVSDVNVADQLGDSKNMFYTDGQRVVAVYFDHVDTQLQPLCFVNSNSSRLHIVMSKPTYVSTDSMEAIIEECKRINNKSSSNHNNSSSTIITTRNNNQSIQDYIEHVRRKRAVIPLYPGTKWCGEGNTSNSYDDLGENRETDKCCRAHDHCQDYILPFSRRYGLFNWSAFTRCSCDCDNELYNCLKNSTDAAADRIGYIFFNVLGTECFRYEFTKMCMKKILFLCVEYGLNTAQPKVMRFFKGRKY